MTKPLFIVGTRPEIIKVSSLVNKIDCKVLFTGQHFDNAMSEFFFKLIKNAPLINLKGTNYRNKNWGGFTDDIKSQIKKIRPSTVIVQGDTNTAFAGALAAFYMGIPVAHVEAGLRTDDLHNPFPEEANRRMISQISALHFAPTEISKANLLLVSVSIPAPSSSSLQSSCLIRFSPSSMISFNLQIKL